MTVANALLEHTHAVIAYTLRVINTASVQKINSFSPMWCTRNYIQWQV